MSESDNNRRVNFWKVVGLALAAAIGLTLIYMAIRPGFSLEAWSDALCISSILLGLGGGIPFLLDAGRGLTIATKMGADDEERQKVLKEERRKRERGMRITFALILAAFLIGVASLVASLW